MEAAGVEPASEELTKEVSPGSAFRLHPARLFPEGRKPREAGFRLAGRLKAGFRVGYPDAISLQRLERNTATSRRVGVCSPATGEREADALPG